jgi:hypothetical protein
MPISQNDPLLDPDRPFDVEEAKRIIGGTLLSMAKLMLRVPGQMPDAAALDQASAALPVALAQGSRACTELVQLREQIRRQQDQHRPRPHADPQQPGALCVPCSVHGSLVSWPCALWSMAEALLTGGAR